MSETTGFESLFPTDILINGIAAGLFMFGVWYVIKRIVDHDYDSLRSYLTLGLISYIAYLYFSWSLCAPIFQDFFPVDIFDFVFYATAFLILFPVAIEIRERL